MDNKDLKKRGLVGNGYILPYNPKLTERAKDFRNNMTMAEKKLWIEFLKNHKYRFRAQKQIDNYIVDFYCSSHKLIIEIDGETHNSFERLEYDEERTKVFESYGLRVVRVKNQDVIYNFEDVCKKINEAC
ncbi:MAG: endonuclease domain-containing protein, partial [Deltaproteobacteria bacterium]